MERSSRASPLHSPPCPDANPDSRLFVLPHSHGLIVVLLSTLHDSCRLCLPSCFRSCIFEGRVKRKKGEVGFLLFILLFVQVPAQTVDCLFCHPHPPHPKLIVVLLYVLMNNDDDRRPKAPPPPVGARGRHHNDRLRRSWTGMLQRVYKPNQPLLYPFLQHLPRALTHLRQWQ